MAQQTTSLIMDLTGWKLLNNNIQEEVLPPYLWTGVERWMLKSDRLVCEKNATKAQPVTNCNLGSINSVNLIMKCIYHLSIVRGRIFVTVIMARYPNRKRNLPAIVGFIKSLHILQQHTLYLKNYTSKPVKCTR